MIASKTGANIQMVHVIGKKTGDYYEQIETERLPTGLSFCQKKKVNCLTI